VELLVAWLPLEEPGLDVGPAIWDEPRVLAVGAGHPLAGRRGVSIEALADHAVASFDRMPAHVAPAIPRRTPAGRPIPRASVEVQDPSELVVAIARGQVVHPTVQSFAQLYAHPRVVYLPIEDAPPQRTVLVGRVGEASPLVRDLLATAAATHFAR
jgi:DNA-binding transcriptional LysR family regulator